MSEGQATIEHITPAVPPDNNHGPEPAIPNRAERRRAAKLAEKPVPPPPPAPDPLPLTSLERMAVEGMLARDREANRLVAEVRAGWAKLWPEVEDRLELPRGSIGKTHTVDDQFNVVAAPPQGPPAPPK